MKNEKLEKYRSASETFCLFPFTHLNFRPSGVSACFRCQVVEPIGGDRWAELWNGPNMRRLRQDLLSGKKPPSCRACWIMEESGSQSYRQKLLQDEELVEQWAGNVEELDEADFSLPLNIRETELRFSNSCNLKCKMCGPRFSTQWEKELLQNKGLKSWILNDVENRTVYISRDEMVKYTKLTDQVLQYIKDIRGSIEHLMISGGEPLIEPHHIKALELLLPRAPEISLEYTTNLNIKNIGELKLLDLWSKFKHLYLKVSLDGDPEIYPYVRDGGETALVEKNLKEIRRIIPPQKLRFDGTCTTSVYNIERLPETMNYITSLGLWGHTSLVEFPNYLSVQVLPETLKSRVAGKIENYLKNLESELSAPFEKSSFWNSDGNRKMQVERVQKSVLNCLNFMKGAPSSLHRWSSFLEFNAHLDPQNRQLFKLYPHWKGLGPEPVQES